MALLLATGSVLAGARVIYVNKTATGTTPDGKSWATAYQELQPALDAAATTATAAQPVEIWITSGCYYPSNIGTTNGDGAGFRLCSHLRIFGGFKGNETSSGAIPGNRTVLSADIGTPMVGSITADGQQYAAAAPKLDDPGWKDNVPNVLVGNRLTDVILTDLVITGGSAMVPSSVIPQIDVDGMETFSGKDGDTSALVPTVAPLKQGVAGAGIFFTGPGIEDPTNLKSSDSGRDLQIYRCLFVGNHARGFGGAMVVRDALVEIGNATFDRNTSDFVGGAISALNSNLVTVTSFFTNNYSTTSGGAVDLKSYPSVPTPKLDLSGPVPALGTAGIPATDAGSTRDKTRVAIGYAISGALAVKKAIAVYQTPGGLGAKVKAGLPSNPFGKDKSFGDRAGAAYAAITLAVTVGDFGVNAALFFGVDPNDQNIKNWQTFSYYFNTYATPQGLASWLVYALIGSTEENGDLRHLWNMKYVHIAEHYSLDTPSYFYRCTFDGNTTTGTGGALSDLYANIQVESSTFTKNTATTAGGAIHAGGYTIPRIVNTIFYQNFSDNGSSAMANADNSDAQILNCTFYKNTSNNDFGHALTAEDGSTVRVSNSLFWGNINSQSVNVAGGADAYAASPNSISEDNRLRFLAADGERVDMVGTIEFRNCDIESLNRLFVGAVDNTNDNTTYIPFNSLVGRTQNDTDANFANYYRAERFGDERLLAIVNAGWGFRRNVLDADQRNISVAPLLVKGAPGEPPLVPSATSPLIDAGSDDRLNGTYTHPLNSVDALGNDRRRGTAVDIGAVEGYLPHVDWANGHRIFIGPFNTGDGSGNDWDNTSDQLAEAMSTPNTEVWVKAGTYSPSDTDPDAAFVLASGTRVYGGFGGTEYTLDERDHRDWKNHRTNIQGFGRSKHLVTCADANSSTLLDGIYFSGAYSVNDTSTGPFAGAGALAVLRSEFAVNNCVFSNNEARNGGAIWSGSAPGHGPQLTNCEFYGNSATASGGALYYDTGVLVTNSRFYNQSAQTGGAIYSSAAGDSTIKQSIFWENRSTQDYGGAIYSANDSLQVNGSIFYRNFASSPGGAGIYLKAPNPKTGQLRVSNSILVRNNTANSGTDREKQQLATASSELVGVSHSIIEGLNAYRGASTDANFDGDPAFVSPGGDTADFHLLASSPAINAGADNFYNSVLDLDGAARVALGAIDIGPFEYSGAYTAGAVGLSPTITRTAAMGSINYTFAVNTPAGSTGLQWQVDQGDGNWVSVSSSSVYFDVATNTLRINGVDTSMNGYRYRLAFQMPGSALTYYSTITSVKAAPSVIYVKADSIGGNTGTSWDNACTTIAAALALADSGTQIWVAAGTYHPPASSSNGATLSMRSGISILGGFSGTETSAGQRDWRANPTIISGDLSLVTGVTGDRSSAIFNNTSGCDLTAILDGFTISDAAKYGVFNVGGAVTIRNCLFKNNLGPAIGNGNGSNSLVTDCQFLSNTATAGAAIDNSGSAISIENCLFANNTNTNSGFYSGTVALNRASGSKITNCTFANNSSRQCGAALTVSNSTVGLYNSVVWGNTVAYPGTPASQTAIYADVLGTTGLTIANSCLQGSVVTTNGNFSLDPLFLDPTQADYRISQGSPLRFAGSPSYPTVSGKDLLGVGINPGAVGVGAYQRTDNSVGTLQISSLPPAIVKVKTSGGGTANLSWSAPSGSYANLSWQVNVNDGAGWIDLPADSRYHVVTDAGGSTLTIGGVGPADNGLQVRLVGPPWNFVSPPSTLVVIDPVIVYVDGTATSGLKNGQSWSNAYTDLGSALAVATEKNEIWVAKGIYTAPGSVSLPANVEVYGGFAGGESSRSPDWNENETILRPAAGFPTVSANYSSTDPIETFTTLDGFILENAAAQPAVSLSMRNVSFEHCTFRNNAVNVSSRLSKTTFALCTFSGGTSSAFQSVGGSSVFNNCRFQDFVTDKNTRVVQLGDDTGAPASAVLADCVFTNNNGGGSLYATGSTTTLNVTRCQFLDNSSYYSGSVFSSFGATAKIESSLFVRNSSSQSGGAVMNDRANLTVWNSDFVDNSAAFDGGAIKVTSGALSTSILNSIFWGNRTYLNGANVPTIEAQQISNDSTTCSVASSIIEGLDTWNANGNLKFYPQFVDPYAGNYRVLANSFAINRGTRTSPSSADKDLDLNARVSGSRQDIGAYEFQGTPVNDPIQLTQAAQSVSVPALSQTSFTYTGYNFTWQVFDSVTQTWVTVDPASPDYHVVRDDANSSSTLVINGAPLSLDGTQFRVLIGQTPLTPVTLHVKPPQIVYVDGDISASGDGKSWTGAFKTVQEAVTASVAISKTASAEIWVKQGTYAVASATRALPMSWQVQLYGGFAGTESTRGDRDWVHNVTTFTSAGNGTILEDLGLANRGYGGSLLDGFTISGATTVAYNVIFSAPTIRNCTFDGGASGISIGSNSSPIIRGCTFRNLTVSGLRTFGDSLVLDNCSFVNNACSVSTLEIDAGTSTITNCRFTGNTGRSVLVEGYGGPSRISHCKFTGNTITGDLIDAWANATIDNTLVADNVSTKGYLVSASGTALDISYSTIANNRSAGPAIDCFSGPTTVEYSILWGNRNTAPSSSKKLLTAQQAAVNSSNGATLTIYRGIREGVQDTYDNESYGYDPLFANSGAGDYTLSANSPAIGHGDSLNAARLGTTDLAGLPRIYPSPSGVADVGAYEYQSAPSLPLNLYGDYGSKRAIVGSTVSFSFMGPGEATQWQVDRGAGFVNVTTGGDVTVHAGNPETLTLANVTLAMSGYKYRFVISGAHPYTSPAATLTVVTKPIIYVDAAATGTGDGTSWPNAYPNLGSALTAVALANLAGDTETTAEIWVAGGSYDLSDTGTTISRGMEIYGGFAGGETSRNGRDVVAHEVRLLSDGGQVLTFTDKPDSIYGDPVLDGLTFTSSGIGLGVAKSGGNLTINNCKFVGLEGGGVYGEGGTLHITNSTFDGGLNSALILHTYSPQSADDIASVLVQNCVFKNGVDAAIDCNVATLTIEDSLFQNNTSTKGSSPCLLAESGSSTVNLTRCQFLNNRVVNDIASLSSAGAITNLDGSMTIRESLFAGNRGSAAGAVENRGAGTLRMYGVTAANNTVSSSSLAGAVLVSGGHAALSNSILWGNTAETGGVTRQVVAITGGTWVTTNTALGNEVTFSPGDLAISYDPQFVGGGNYRLASSSPYIGKGRVSDVLSGEIDLAGNNRLTAGKTDLGAYENGVSVNPISVAQTPVSTTQASGGDVVLSIAADPGYTYTWEYNDGSGWKSISQWPAGTPLGISQSGGINTLTLSGVPLSLDGVQFRVSIDGAGYTSAPVTVTVVAPQIMYVRSDASAGGDGTSWATAYNSLETAISKVTVMRRIIRVAAGTYFANNGYLVTKRMEIYGGFPAAGGDPGSRDPVGHPTILSGAIPNSSSRVPNVFSLYGGDPESTATPALQSDTVIDGLTIQDGQTGLSGTLANATLRDLVIKNNLKQGMSLYRVGGLIEHCQLLGNSGYGGAGASFSDCEARVTRCVFQGNVASATGGGLSISNTGRRFPAPMKMDDLLVSGNSAVQAGGIDISNCSVTIDNSTIAGNWAGSGGVGGISSTRATTTLRNSVVWGNRSAIGTLGDQQVYQNPYLSGSISLSSCDVEGTSNSVDPLFLSVVEATSAGSLAGDFRLNSSSALIDAGNSAFATDYTVDLAGATRRYQDGTVDIGAYEYQGAPDAPLVITQQPADLVFTSGGANQFLVQLSGSGFTYQWESSKSGVAFTPVVDGAGFSGAQTATLTVLQGDLALDGTLFRCAITAAAGGVGHSMGATLTVYPARYYVNASAMDDTGDGLTWGTAVKTLSRATSSLRVHPVDGVEIWVAAGTYVTGASPAATFALKDKVSLYGGFAGGESLLTQRDPSAHPTILNGVTGASSIITGSETGTARVDGFTIGTGSIGIVAGGAMDLTVANCAFIDLAKGIRKEADGSVASVQGVTVQACRFTSLTAAGIENIRGPLTVTDSVFLGNGRGIFHYAGPLQVVRSEFRGNGSLTANGGGLSAQFSPPGSVVESSLFSGNIGSMGAGIYEASGTLAILDCTLAGNYAGTTGAALYAVTDSSITLNNSIVWANASAVYGTADIAQLMLRNPIAYGNDVPAASLSTGLVQAINGNVSVDPLFAQPITAGDTASTAGDFHLTSLSKLIDAGSSSHLGNSATDLAKAARVFGAAVDPGAYEFPADVLAVTSQPANASAGSGVPATFTVSTNAASATYQWQQSVDGVTFVDFGAPISAAGTSTLTVPGDAGYNGYKFRVHVTTTQPGDVVSSAASYTFVNTTTLSGLPGFNTTLTGSTSTVGFQIPGGPLAGTVNDASVAVHASQTGRLSLSGLTISGDTVTLHPSVPLKAGELVEVTTTSQLKNGSGYASAPFVYQFHAGNLGRYGVFPEVQNAGTAPAGTQAIAVGDLNGDGLNDLVVGGASGAAVLLNNGSAAFTVSSTFGSGAVARVVLGSLRPGGQLDAVLVKADGSVETWAGNGDGTFTQISTLGGTTAKAAALADFNADGKLDLFLAGTGADQVWFGNGDGTFVSSGQALGSGAGKDIAVGDLDNDGDLDVCVANGAGDLEIWANNGAGIFTAAMDSSATRAVAPVGSPADRVILADLDGDGDLDLVVAHSGSPVQFWLQTSTRQLAGPFRVNGTDGALAGALAVGDIDGDGRPDLIAASAYGGKETVFKGKGFNSSTGYVEFQYLAQQPALAVFGLTELADLDGDGSLDLVAVSTGGSVQASRYRAIDLTLAENQAGALPAAQFGVIYNHTVAHGSGRTLSDVRIESLPSHGTLSQAGTPVNVGQVIPVASLALTLSPASDFHGSDEFTWSGSSDGATFDAAAYAFNIQVDYVAQSLTAQPDSLTVVQGGSTSVLDGAATSVLANDDGHGDPLTAAVLVPPAHGSLTLNADGTFTYTHDGSELPRVDQFTYQVTNTASGETGQAVVSIAVTNRNDAPSDITFVDAGIYERSPVGTLAGTFTVTDPDPETGAVAALSLVPGAVDNALFTLSGNDLLVNSAVAFADGATRTVRVVATDPGGLTLQKDVAVTFRSQPAATDLSTTVLEDGAGAVTLSGTNADGRAITYAIAVSPAHGTLTVSGSSVVYQPTPLFWGSDSFTYTASDGTVTSAPATVSITVTHVNHTPEVTPQTLAVTENMPLNFTVAGTDPDGDPLTFTVVSTSAKGVVTGTSPNFVFTPAEDQTGDFRLFAVASDGAASSPGILIDGTIATVDYQPTAQAQSTSTAENAPLALELHGFERNGKAITYGISTAPAHGRLSGTAPNVVYTPDRNYHGPDAFEFTVTSAVGTSAPATVSIDVFSVNAAPEAVPQDVATNQLQPVAITLSAIDDGSSLSYAITQGPQHGTLTGTGASRIYTPAGAYSGPDRFEFAVSDGQYSDVAVVNITVNETDLPPTADSATVSSVANVPATITLVGSDPKNLPITYEITSLPAHGTLSGSVPTGLVFTPVKNYVGADSFTFKTNNGKLDSDVATVSVNFTKDVGFLPSVGDDFAEAYKNETITIDVLANDADFYGDPLTIESVTTPPVGSAAISNNKIVYTAGSDVGGTVVFQYTARNDAGASAVGTVFVTTVNQDLVVTNGNDSGPGSLRNAISLVENSHRPSSSGWNVTFAEGVQFQPIQLTTGNAGDPDSALRVAGNINITSTLAPAPEIHAAAGGVPLRIFHVMPGGQLHLSGVKLTGGIATKGGAILNEGSLIADTTVMTGNTAVANGSDPGLGGAIYSTGVTSLIHSTLASNVATLAGGLYQIGDGAAVSTTIDTSTFSGQSASGDFLSTAVNGGTASIDATALTTETPTAPWFGALPASATIASQFLAKLPVSVDGDAYALTASSSNPAMSNVSWTGRGTTRTLKLSGFAPVNGATTRLTATASDGHVSYVQHTNLTVDPSSHRTPVVVDDKAAVQTSASVLIPVLANDYDPDGGVLRIASVTQPSSGGSVAIEGDKIRFTQNGDISAVNYSFTYTVANSSNDSATGNVSILRASGSTLPVISSADSGSNTLRNALDTANQYYNPDGWVIQIRANYDGGALLIPATAGDHGVGDSAFLVTGRVTIDGSAIPGFAIQRDASGPSMRLFRVTDTGDLTLKNVTLDGGIGKHGGVVLNEGALHLDHSTVEHGAAVVGGGVFNEGSLVTDTAQITTNTASSLGGALYNRNGTAQLNASSLTNNLASDGGGVHLFGDGDYSLVQIVGTTVTNSGAAHDLSASVTGAGTTAFTAAGSSTVAVPGATWINPIADQAVDGTGTVPFTFAAPVSATISAESQNEVVVQQSGLSIGSLTSNSGTLQIVPRANGFADIAVLATQGPISFGQIFKLSATGAFNAPPIAGNDSATLYKGAQVTIPVLANDSDPEGATLSIQSVGMALHGTVAISGTSVVYTHDGSDTTSDTFTYVVSDGFGGTATGTVTVTVQDTIRTVTSNSANAGAGTFRDAMDFAAAHPTSAPWKIVFSSSIPAGSVIQYSNYGPTRNGYTMFLINGNVLLDGSQVPRNANGTPGLTLRNNGGVSGPPQRFFYVAAGARLEVRSMILADGMVISSGSADTGKVSGGGAVLNDGTFIAKDVVFSNNSAVSVAKPGGAIASSGTVTVTDCTFAKNLSNVAGAAIYSLGNASHAELNITGSTFTTGTSTAGQVQLATSNGGTVTRNGSRNVLPAGEAVPWIGSIATTTSISGPTDVPVTLGLPVDSYTVSSSASPSEKVSSIGLTGTGASRTLSVTPANGAYGAVDLIATLVNGSITVNETFAGSIVPPTPDAPTGLTATAVSDTQIALAWTDHATTETGYTVERSANGTDGWTVVTSTLAANATSYVDAALAPATAQFYRVRCDVGTVASSSYSNTASATTAATIGDGLPGSWRYQYFGDGTTVVAGSEPGTDYDGDGLTNLQEYLAGTSPVDAASALVAKLERIGTDAVISFPTVIGKTYQVEAADELASSTVWTVLATDIAGTGGTVQYTDTTTGTHSQRFYRVSIKPTSGPSLASSDPVGYRPVDCLASSDTLTGLPFTRSPEFTGTIASVSGNVLTLGGAPNFTPDQFVRVAGSQPKTYYVQIGSHASVNPNEGRIYTITANGAGSLTVDLNGDTASAIAAGTPISVIPYWTLNTLFPASDVNVSFTPSPSGFFTQTQILIPDYTRSGINLAAAQIYYYLSEGTNVGWRKAGSSNTVDRGDEILNPRGYLIVRNAGNAPQRSLVFSGSVSTKKITTPLTTRSDSEQDNFVSLARPADATLDSLGLSPAAGNFVGSADGFTVKDELLVFDNSTPAMNRAAAKIYFYLANVGWRKAGDNIATDHGADVIPAGAAIIIRKAATVSGAASYWSNSPVY